VGRVDYGVWWNVGEAVLDEFGVETEFGEVSRDEVNVIFLG